MGLGGRVALDTCLPPPLTFQTIGPKDVFEALEHYGSVELQEKLQEWVNASDEALSRRRAFLQSRILTEFDKQVTKLFRDQTKGLKRPREREIPEEHAPEAEFVWLHAQELQTQYEKDWEIRGAQMPFGDFGDFCLWRLKDDLEFDRKRASIPGLPRRVQSSMYNWVQLKEYLLSKLAQHAEEDAIREQFLRGVRDACASPVDLDTLRQRLSDFAKRLSGLGGRRKTVGTAFRDLLGDGTEDLMKRLDTLGVDETTLLCDTRQLRHEKNRWEGKRDEFEQAARYVERILGKLVVNNVSRDIDDEAYAKLLWRAVAKESDRLTVDELDADTRAEYRRDGQAPPLVDELAKGISRLGVHDGAPGDYAEKRARSVSVGFPSSLVVAANGRPPLPRCAGIDPFAPALVRSRGRQRCPRKRHPLAH